MKKIFLFISLIGCCFAAYSQIHVDGSATGSGNGSTSNPFRTIQAAIDAANNGDVIKVAKGTYAETLKIEQKKVQLTGGFAGGGSYATANPQANVTIIQGTASAPCIYVYIDKQLSGSLLISGFTIRNGQRGIELTGGWSGFLDNITIENNIIENNGTKDLKQDGGGIGLEGKNVTIRNNIIRNNTAGRGAGISRTDDPVNFLIADNRIENNSGYNDHAGGAYITGTGTVTRNIFDGNVAALSYDYGWGGGLLVTNYDMTKEIILSHNIWRNNSAPSRGGGVFVDEEAKVRMENELFYNNKSKESGSAIYVDEAWTHAPSEVNMFNCTVVGNSTTASGGAALYVESSRAIVQNCIFWNNGSDFQTVSNGQLSVTYTLTQQGFTGTGNISSDPLFANASSGDFHLKSMGGRYDPSTGQFVKDAVHSPAIDAGNPASDFSKEPAPNGGRVNLGCYGNTAEASKSAVSANEAITPIGWTVYPNPAKESITISRLQGLSTIYIFDLTGRNVYRSVVDNEQTTISTANFENGVYIIQVTYNGAVSSRKLVVNK